MNSIDRYKDLEIRQRELTELSLKQRAELDALRLKGKLNKRESLAKERLEKENESTLLQLKSLMDELPLVQAAALRDNFILSRTKPIDTPAQPDNSVVYVEGDIALVMCADGRIAYTLQPEGAIQIGDLAFQTDLKDFSELSVEQQTRLMDGYNANRERGCTL